VRAWLYLHRARKRSG